MEGRNCSQCKTNENIKEVSGSLLCPKCLKETEGLICAFSVPGSNKRFCLLCGNNKEILTGFPPCCPKCIKEKGLDRPEMQIYPDPKIEEGIKKRKIESNDVILLYLLTKTIDDFVLTTEYAENDAILATISKLAEKYK